MKWAIDKISSSKKVLPALTETVSDLRRDLNYLMESNLNKKLNHNRNLSLLTPEQKASEINQGPVLEVETQHRFTNKAYKQDLINKLVELADKQLEEVILDEGLLTSAMLTSQTLNQARQRGTVPTPTNRVKLDDEEDNQNRV